MARDVGKALEQAEKITSVIVQKVIVMEYIQSLQRSHFNIYKQFTTK